MSAQHPNNIGNSELLYQQLPLDELQIRLLRLEPKTGSTKIQASLIKRNLLDIKRGGPFFEALSYTWGPPTVTKDILINGIAFPVTANLYAFLENYQEAGQGVDLWIDAICVNQSDLLEKNHQIPMMNLIYAAARALIIWLGEPSSDSDRAMDWINHLGHASPYDKMPNIPNHAWQAMQSLLERPWWKRIWIVQELTAGAMGLKLDKASIICGHIRVSWMSVVIAAARIKAYQDDRRQAFPTITEILELDSLRDSAGYYFTKEPTSKRDKIYAIWNMFSRVPSKRLPTRYDQSVEDVYVDFAAELLSGETGLEVLRHCVNGSADIPSWAPDWARFGDDEARETPAGFHVNPLVSSAEEEVLRERRIKRLEIAANGSAVVKSLKDIPDHFTFHKQCPDHVKEQIEAMLSRNDFILAIGDENPNMPENPDAIQQGELITERQMKKWLLQELRHSTAKPLYATAMSVNASFKINKNEKSLQIKGVLWDEVEVCHDSFVEDIDQNLADATNFIVAVGCCKHLAVSNKSAANRYPTAAELLEAFWSTLFVGQAIPDEDDETKDHPRYEDWLPEIPKSWVPGQPPITARTTGLISLAEMNEVIKRPTSIFNKEKERDGGSRFEHRLAPQLREEVFPPHNDEYVALFGQLASAWHQQPYDLYHRPFDLLNVIPGPYWESRRHRDELAKHQAKNRRSRGIKSYPEAIEDPSDQDFLRRAYDEVDETLKQEVSLVPQNTLPADIEKYALGRKFFITKKGYFGLGPHKSELGDRVAVLFGSGVPFVLRKCVSATGKRAWKIVGECYVHGIMQGEVIQKWNLGSAEAQMLLLL
ncbi:heterokaryon incompatibility protein (HET) domain-containing protein [Trichoderma breve]|uniref:Heterokaryon incompatibility protein (HET) domain-containing protein n=1 Tax=Trichoderma breve TaxID=2034170 RepID=A0A9W9E9L5_9HYPO|nr:heterokaryon incompatibility protein (HET) domain-containing protein [Trichoderma breve]KAJ4860016.1 heterokaryon incompatibility protein (HET) domain-containing protein [Trichoderma breve]